MNADTEKYEMALREYSRADYDSCFSKFLELSAEGHAKSSFYAASIFLKGTTIVPPNANRARQMYRTALDQAFLPGAALSLALMEYQGEGGGKDYESSMRHYMLVKGNPFAKVMIGTMKLHGRGCMKDEDEALRWFNSAWSLGHPLGLRAAAGIRIRRGHYVKGFFDLFKSSILIMWFYGLRQISIVKSPHEELGLFWKIFRR
jgi:TPR repeat protein